MTMKVRSLFSGVGGVDLGLERAGMEVISQCEKDEFRRGILRRHWPDAEVHDDVESVHYEAGSADLLCGGFPCQDLSVAGRRKGLDGARSGLFFEFARIADECVPAGGWVLIENVPGLLSSKDGRDFGVLLRTLADLGFHDIAWRVLDSRYFGVPQRRRRVFILARRASGTRAGQVLLEPEGDGGHPQEGRKKGSKRPLAADGGAGVRRRASLAGSGARAALAGLNDGRSVDPLVSRSSRGEPQPLSPGHNTDSHVVVASALDRMRGGADDNDAQANHIVSVAFDATNPTVDRVSPALKAGGRQTNHSKGPGQDSVPVLATSLTAPKGGAGGSYRLDDNDVRGNHVIPVGLGVDTDVSGTLGKKGVGGGGLGLDREGAMVVAPASEQHRLAHKGQPEVLAFNWQSGGDVRLEVNGDHVPTLQREQVPAVHATGVLGEHSHTLTSEGMDASEDGSGRGTPIVHLIVAPEIAAPLTSGQATGEGVSKPGRRMEDDKNLVAFGAWNMRVLASDEPIGTLLGGSKGAQYSLNNMPLVAHVISGDSLGVADAKSVAENQQGEVVESSITRTLNKAGGKPGQGYPAARVVLEAKSVRENQRGEVDETDYTYTLNKAGGKPGQGYPAARVVTASMEAGQSDGQTGTLAGIDKGNHNRWFDIMMPAGLVRRLTPTECERLQGFPDGWTHPDGPSLAAESSWYEVAVVRTEDGSSILVPRVSDIGYLDRMLASLLGAAEVDEPKPDGRRYAAMGDAVTVPVAHWIGARLLAYGAD